MENKKTKLTISGNPKKSFKNFDSSKVQGKKTVVIERSVTKSTNKTSYNKSPVSRSAPYNHKKGSFIKPFSKFIKSVHLTRQIKRMKLQQIFRCDFICFSHT